MNSKQVVYGKKDETFTQSLVQRSKITVNHLLEKSLHSPCLASDMIASIVLYFKKCTMEAEYLGTNLSGMISLE